MIRAIIIAALLLLPGISWAQTDCLVQTQPQLLQALRDNAPPGTITPRVLRNVVCSADFGGNLFPAPPPIGNVTPNTGALAGVNKWSVDASGNVRAAGTLTGSVTP